MTVAAILARKGADVVSIDCAATVGEAAAALARHRIGALPVLREGAVAGVISERDIVYCLDSDGPEVLGRAVEAVMTSPAITVSPDVSVLAALSQMSARRIRHLPVVEDGRLAGIVSIGDLVAHRIAMIEREAEAMRAYIAGV